MVEDVGGLFGDPLVGLLAGGADDLLGLLLHLFADHRRVVEELDRVAALGALGGAARERALQRRQRLVDDAARGSPPSRLAVEAGSFAGVAGGSGGRDDRQHGVAIAVVTELLHRHRRPRGFAFAPDLVPRAAEEVHLPRLQRQFQRFRVRVGEHQHLGGCLVLHHTGTSPRSSKEISSNMKGS